MASEAVAYAGEPVRAARVLELVEAGDLRRLGGDHQLAGPDEAYAVRFSIPGEGVSAHRRAGYSIERSASRRNRSRARAS